MKPLSRNQPRGFGTTGECRENAALFQRRQRLLDNSLLMVKAAGNADGRRKDDGTSHEKAHECPPFMSGIELLL